MTRQLAAVTGLPVVELDRRFWQAGLAPSSRRRWAECCRWRPRRRFDYVHVNLEAVPARDHGLFVTRTLDVAVAAGGRLIASFYYPSVEHGQHDHAHPAALLRALGLEVAGTADAIGTRLAWTDNALATPR